MFSSQYELITVIPLVCEVYSQNFCYQKNLAYDYSISDSSQTIYRHHTYDGGLNLNSKKSNLNNV